MILVIAEQKDGKLNRASVETIAAGISRSAEGLVQVAKAQARGNEETAGQLAAVRKLGCSHAQGFHLGVPLPAEEAHERLAAAI